MKMARGLPWGTAWRSFTFGACLLVFGPEPAPETIPADGVGAYLTLAALVWAERRRRRLGGAT